MFGECEVYRVSCLDVSMGAVFMERSRQEEGPFKYLSLCSAWSGCMWSSWTSYLFPDSVCGILSAAVAVAARSGGDLVLVADCG